MMLLRLQHAIDSYRRYGTKLQNTRDDPSDAAARAEERSCPSVAPVLIADELDPEPFQCREVDDGVDAIGS
jgi:hypothetical protein